MPTINVGPATRFQNGGILYLDGDDIGKLEGAGLLRITGGHFESVDTKTGRNLDETIVGDEAPLEVELQCRIAYNATAGNLIQNIWKPTHTDGIKDRKEFKIALCEGVGSTNYNTLTLDEFELMPADIVPSDSYVVATLRGRHMGPTPDWVAEVIA